MAESSSRPNEEEKCSLEQAHGENKEVEILCDKVERDLATEEKPVDFVEAGEIKKTRDINDSDESEKKEIEKGISREDGEGDDCNVGIVLETVKEVSRSNNSQEESRVKIDVQEIRGEGNGSSTIASKNELIHLNIGGTHYVTTRSTLTRFTDSMLGAMFGNADFEPTLRDENRRYFIDRDGAMFKYVLNYLRSQQLSLPEDFNSFSELKVESDYYQVPGLLEAVESAHSVYMAKRSKKKEHESGDFIEIRETHYGRTKDFREQMERVHMMFIGRWSYINEFRVFLQSSRLADGTEGLPGVQCMIYGDYCEMSWTSEEQYFRIKLGDYLSRMGWKLTDSSIASSACEYYNYRTNTKVDGAIHKIFRDKWFKLHAKQ